VIKILKLIKDFFSSLLSGNSEAYKKQRELKRIQKEIRQHKPLVYKQSTGQLLPQLAGTLFTFLQYLKPLKELIYKTLLNENDRLSDMYKDYLIEVRLQDEFQLKKQSFTYDKIRERLLFTVSLKTESEILSKEFADFLKLFSGTEFSNFDAEFSSLERFIALCRHDFIRLLMYFDPDASLSRKYKPSFSACIGHHANQELMDLYLVFAELNLNEGIEKNLVFLLKRVKEHTTHDDELKIKKIIEAMGNIHRTSFSPEMLLNLLRVINADPTLTVKTDTSTKTFLEVYKSKLSSRFQMDMEKVTRECNEREILADLTNLFGAAELLETEGYGEDLAKMLQAESFNSFTHIKPLSIVKSFTVLHFEKRIQETVKRIVINGFFEQKEFRERFINLFHSCQGAHEAVTRFEEALAAPGEVSISKIRKYLVDYKNGKSVGYALNKLIETINNMALKIIEENTNLFYSFQGVISEIIKDSKQRAPQLISNIKVIGGDKNQEFTGNLADALKKLELFTSIMKNFTIIRPHLEKEQLQELLEQENRTDSA
jgi:hypothetical protein